MDKLTPEIIESGNRLIAEYMQLKKLTESTWINPVLACSTDGLSYHDSWGWLMPVIEKISNYRWPEYFVTTGKREGDWEYEDCVYLRTFGKRDNKGNYMVRLNASGLFYGKTLIEATWEAVVDFVKEYNSLTQNNSNGE